jgi:phosphomethylpyrimidine synthase
MEQAAIYYGVEPEEIRRKLAAGSVVIPQNRLRTFEARAIGLGFSTKINADIGTSGSHASLPEEIEKLRTAIEAGADAVMDLSTGGDIDAILVGMIEHSSVMIGTVPIYRPISRLFAGGLTCGDLTEDVLFADIEHEARRVRCMTEDRDRDVCTMCGGLCTIKTYNRFPDGTAAG